ncbi:MAG TPA: VOC family protein [Puia sp.]|jgi:PhnB protein
MNSFAPSLSLRVVAPAVEFYKKAFGVTESRIFKNDDGSIHVAELLFGDAVFFMHEEMSKPDSEKAPESLKGTTVVLTIFVDDPDALMASALAAGARELNPMQDHFYGYRQGVVIDPFGHQWMLQKKI